MQAGIAVIAFVFIFIYSANHFLRLGTILKINVKIPGWLFPFGAGHLWRAKSSLRKVVWSTDAKIRDEFPNWWNSRKNARKKNFRFKFFIILILYSFSFQW
jgi:hypothetical protein